ncbi:MAG: putative polysaccharide biosynthesis protein, partial [Anaerolineales bacterium]|nr:putative polysaccharide biosynthesis protein [Anaerolineales bacterium]
TLGGRTLLPADNLTAFEPFKSAASQFGVDAPHNQLLSDLVLENYPWKKFILESLRARQLPLWNPYLFAGVPFLAAGQHSALYPFSVIFYIVPLPRAYGLFTVSQFFLAGLFAYLFIRVLGLRRLSALFGAIVYQLSLFMVVSVVFPMIVAGTVWLPLVLTAIELIARQHPALGGRSATLPWLVLGALALGMQVLAGHVEITYYTLLVSGAYSAWRLIVLYREERQGRGEGVPSENSALSTNFAVKKVLSRASALLALACLGLALGAIQLIPLFELVRYNFRSGSATFDQIIGWAYPWRHVLLFLIPNFYGNPSHHAYFDLFTWQWTPATVNAPGEPLTTIDWGQTPFKNYVEGGSYLGLLPLFLTGIVAIMWLRALRSKDERLSLFRNPFIPFFLTLGFFALSFAFPTRLYALIFWLPGINQLHSPFRWVWPLSLCAAVLSAYGIEHLWRSHPAQMRFGYYILRRKASAPPTLAARLTAPLFLWSSPSLITFFAGIAVWGGALIVAALSVARLWYEPLGVARFMDRFVAGVTFATHMFADGRMAFSYEARWVFIFALLLVASGIVLRVSRCSIYVRGRTIWEPLALGVIVLDLFVAGHDFNSAADPAILTYTPPSVEFLQQDTGLWRFTTYDTSKCRPTGNDHTEPCKPFNANIGWYFNFYDVRGYDSIFPMQYRRYMELIQPQYELDYNRIAPISDPTALDSPLLDLLNVKYVITQEPIAGPKYTLVYSAEVQIYQNMTVMPRAYIQPISATVVAEEFGTAVQKYDPRQYVIVTQSSGVLAHQPTGTWPTPIPDGDILYTPSEVTLTAAVAEDSRLVLADSYFPGWKAYIRPAGAGEEAEKEAEISLVNGNFRGVQLPPGAWTVRFKYSPDSFKLGGIISFIAGVIIFFGTGVWTWRYFYRESAVDSTARRVAKNSLAPMALNLMNRGIDLIFAAFYMRVLGPADVGKYAFAIVVFGWFEIVTNYGLNTLLTRDVSRDRQHANRYLVNTTILRLLLGVVAIPGLVLLLGLRQLLPSSLTSDTLLAITLLVIAQAPATISTGLTALFYVYEQAEYPAAVATVSTIIKVTLGTVALILGMGFVGLAGVSIVVNVVTLGILAALAVRLFFRPQWELDWGLQRGAVRESFPLMLNHLLATLFFKVDVPMLETIRNQQEAGRGDREVGWYRTAYQFLDAYNVIPSFFTVALFPLMSRQAKEDRAALTRSYALAVKLLVGVALPLAVVTAFLAPFMVGLLGGSKFLPYGAIALAIMVWSIPFGWINSVTNYLLIALDQQRGLTRAFAIALAFNVICNLIFIPRYGYPAAAVITIASEIFEGAAFYWYLRKSLGPLPLFGWLWRLWVSAGAMAGVVYGLWAIQPLVALMAGLGVNVLGVFFLKAFTREEQSTLAEILPSRIRERLRIKITNDTN